ncbi:MAG: ComF family protein [candidate division WOR-3 bacterium]|nr:ComF family protein [candidate division WOR-3 bacterium]
MGFSSSARFLLRSLADFVFPPICYGCDSEIETGLVCEACRLDLFTHELAVCSKCGRPCTPATNYCGQCAIPFSLSRVRGLGFYAPPFDKLVQAFKYSGKTKVGELLGQALAALVRQDEVLSAADAVCPVPLHPARLRERGFNQSLLLAAAISMDSGIPLADCLIRHRNTSTQTMKTSPEARRKNLERAFRVRPEPGIAGKTVLLVDDVMTTGATLDQAARELLKGGAASVLGVVIAAAHAGARPSPS